MLVYYTHVRMFYYHKYYLSDDLSVPYCRLICNFKLKRIIHQIVHRVCHPSSNYILQIYNLVFPFDNS
jgi:hypothetical protein